MPDRCLMHLGLAGGGPLTMAALSPGQLPCGWRWAGRQDPVVRTWGSARLCNDT